MINNTLVAAAGKGTTRYLSVVLAILIAISLLIPINMQQAHAVPTSAQKQAEADEASVKLIALQAEKTQMEEDYNQAVSAHSAALASMQEAQERITAAQAIIADTQDKLGARASNMYRNGPLSFLDVLFGATSFEQFTTSWDILSNINNQNAALIQANKEAREEAKAAHDIFSAQEQIAADRLAEADAIMKKAEENVAAQAAELAGLESEVAALVAAELGARNPISSGGGGSGSWQAPSGSYGDIISAALSRQGAPYVWAGAGPDEFDCSGFTMWVYAQVGIYLSHGAYDQWASAPRQIPVSEAQPGDLLYRPGHIGIYLGGGSYIDSEQDGVPVGVRSGMGTWTGAASYF